MSLRVALTEAAHSIGQDLVSIKWVAVLFVTKKKPRRGRVGGIIAGRGGASFYVASG